MNKHTIDAYADHDDMTSTEKAKRFYELACDLAVEFSVLYQEVVTGEFRVTIIGDHGLEKFVFTNPE